MSKIKKNSVYGEFSTGKEQMGFWNFHTEGATFPVVLCTIPEENGLRCIMHNAENVTLSTFKISDCIKNQLVKTGINFNGISFNDLQRMIISVKKYSEDFNIILVLEDGKTRPLSNRLWMKEKYLHIHLSHPTKDEKDNGYEQILNIDIKDRPGNPHYREETEENLNQYPIFKVEVVDRPMGDKTIQSIKYYMRANVNCNWNQIYSDDSHNLPLVSKKLDQIKKLFANHMFYLPTDQTTMFRIGDTMYAYESFGTSSLSVHGYPCGATDLDESLKYDLLDYVYVEFFDKDHVEEMHGNLYRNGVCLGQTKQIMEAAGIKDTYDFIMGRDSAHKKFIDYIGPCSSYDIQGCSGDFR